MASAPARPPRFGIDNAMDSTGMYANDANSTASHGSSSRFRSRRGHALDSRAHAYRLGRRASPSRRRPRSRLSTKSWPSATSSASTMPNSRPRTCASGISWAASARRTKASRQGVSSSNALPPPHLLPGARRWAPPTAPRLDPQLAVAEGCPTVKKSKGPAVRSALPRHMRQNSRSEPDQRLASAGQTTNSATSRAPNDNGNGVSSAPSAPCARIGQRAVRHHWLHPRLRQPCHQRRPRPIA
ncbi:hypothetical protein L1887_57172 [Cichorium endivia]|nr:hypothetical protein L1887_57172 [Cichorium endivia]